MPKLPRKAMFARIKGWFTQTRVRLGGVKLASDPRVQRFKRSVRSVGARLSSRFPKKLKDLEFDFRKIELRKVSEYSRLIRWTLLILAAYLGAEIGSKVIGLFVRPEYTQLPKKMAPPLAKARPPEDYDAILRRNMFNVEGEIPEPFDQGQLDCFSQARASGQRMQLLGTIVMSDERFSVALVQEEGGQLKIAARKDDSFFDGKYVAMKVERKRFCFQVRSTQDFEFIEIPEENIGVAAGPMLGGSEGIVPKSETEFSVKKSFLDEKLANLNEILQTAKAVPYIENGKFSGFLVQSIEPGSPFAQLGVRQGDVLLSVNDVNLDTPGKPIEAFQIFRNSSRIALGVNRGGQKMTLTFSVQ